MEIATTPFKHCVLIKVSGRVDSSNAPKLGETLNQVQRMGQFRIVLDMSEVDFISSSGLWVLVNAQKASKRYNRGEVVLACLPEKIHSSLDLAGFIPFFKLFNNVTTAVGNF
ncbi:MAG TPA: STAS domain-containing protein [Anaerolineaceae bacterium]